MSIFTNSASRSAEEPAESTAAILGLLGERGPESVAHMMRLYAGHDILHLRQIERIRRASPLGRRCAQPDLAVRFLEELRRREVVRALLVFMAAAFAVIQAADIVVPALGLPPWTAGRWRRRFDPSSMKGRADTMAPRENPTSEPPCA